VKVCFISLLHRTPRSVSLVPVFIAEITARAFIIADSNKRRTLSRADIAKAVSKSDQFDFLIDILPREEPFPGSSTVTGGAGSGAGPGKGKKAAKQASVSSITCLHLTGI
jgi:nuclear transcription factor Y, gamma